ncbi:DUF47 domain-containing protein [Paraliomyxa miuraensis]|uniref:DUF47 domain-containing protein n=1 Tax=Paraliomyxa miuraensis TaxID=376150 RepID=UPI00225B1A0D|nr:DUF47 family protein [Paraliomyxa miuraensis]MCX4240409.1 DUF47 family protein [Paraliomyxa miuraensis]
MGLQDFIHRLLPRDDRFFDLLERQAGVAHDAAVALASFADPERDVGSVSEEVQEFEHQGDALVHELEESLARTFVTPLDREDIHLLSSALDEVLDLTNYAARACAMLGVERPTTPMVELMRLLVAITDTLKEAVPLLRRRSFVELRAATRKIRQLEKDGDRIHREAVTALFHSEGLPAQVLLREREVLEDLEAAVDRCEKVADQLANLAVKHG